MTERAGERYKYSVILRSERIGMKPVELYLELFRIHTELAKPRNETAELHDGGNPFEDPHMSPADFLLHFKADDERVSESNSL